MSSICEICSSRCFGIDGYDGSCCSLEGRDYIMGPIKDADEFIQRLNDKMGRKFQREDALVDFEEGRRLFPEKSVWQNPGNFPAMRIDTSKAKLPCVFYNTHAKFCSVHDVRPQTCQIYFCGYLKDEIGMEKNTEEKKGGVPKDLPDPFAT